MANSIDQLGGNQMLPHRGGENLGVSSSKQMSTAMMKFTQPRTMCWMTDDLTFGRGKFLAAASSETTCPFFTPPIFTTMSTPHGNEKVKLASLRPTAICKK